MLSLRAAPKVATTGLLVSCYVRGTNLFAKATIGEDFFLLAAKCVLKLHTILL